MEIRRLFDGSVFLISILFVLTHTSIAAADAGDLDTTFGVDGKVTTDFISSSENATGVAIQPDGKIVAAGTILTGTDVEFALARYNPDGSLDTTFSFDGKVTTDFFGDEDGAQDVAIQTDGKIVAAGYAYSGITSDFALVRYNSDGSLDATFDSDGRVTTDFAGGSDQASAVAIQTDGKIVVAGYAPTGGTYNFALARYNSDGSLDTSFDSDGRATADFAGGFDSAMGIAIQPDGKIVVAGSASIAALNELAVARFNPGGSLDTSFDSDGKTTITFNGIHSFASDVAIQSDGKIVVAGDSNEDFILARFNPDGSLDPNFDADGKLTTDFAGGEDRAISIAIQADAKIVAAGNATTDLIPDFALARYNPDGSLDSEFGTVGKVTTAFSSTARAYAVAIQTDGKILAAGASSEDFALARYSGNSTSPLFFDDFNDGDTTGWTHIKPQWIESGGNLIGTPSGRKAVAIASPAFAGCQTCAVEATMQTGGGAFNKLWLLGWYIDKRNTLELLMKEENDRWILKQRINGAVVAKGKGVKTIHPNTAHLVRIAFDGSVFEVFVDDLITPLFTLNPQGLVPGGTAGFQVKNTTGSFGYIAVN